MYGDTAKFSLSFPGKEENEQVNSSYWHRCASICFVRMSAIYKKKLEDTFDIDKIILFSEEIKQLVQHLHRNILDAVIHWKKSNEFFSEDHSIIDKFFPQKLLDVEVENFVSYSKSILPSITQIEYFCIWLK